jgi:hypothetical protein
MKEPPFLISPKDLLYLEDLLSHILVFDKKCKHYLSLVNNQQVHNHIVQVENMLATTYDELLSILDG